MRTMRLGSRLALATGIAVCLAVLLVSAVGFVVIRDQGLNAVDEALLEDARANIAGLEDGDLGERDFLEAPADGASTEVAPDDGALPPGTRVDVGGSGGERPAEPGAPIPETRIDSALPGETGAPTGRTPIGEPFTIEENGRTLRRLVLQRTGADGVVETFTFSRSIADTEAIIRVARYVLLTVAIVASLLAIAFILLLVRAFLRPLEAAQAAAEHVALSGDLSIRIPEGRPDEVGRLAAAMNTMLGRLDHARSRLKETLEEQRTFAADASHELRTPLTALRGDIDLLLTHDIPADERREVLEEMSRSSDRMGNLIEGLLSLARLDAIPTRTPQAVDVVTLVESLLAEGGSLTAPAPENAHVLGDPEAIRGVFANLIDNANKYGGTITVEIRAEENEVIVVVADDGPGIPVEDRERIFDRFHRAQAVRTRPGAGLGLAIARGAAEAMEGSLDLVPSERGAQFRVRLPRAPAPERQPQTAAERVRQPDL